MNNHKHSPLLQAFKTVIQTISCYGVIGLFVLTLILGITNSNVNVYGAGEPQCGPNVSGQCYTTGSVCEQGATYTRTIIKTESGRVICSAKVTTPFTTVAPTPLNNASTSGSTGGQAPLGLNFLQIIPFTCLFSTQDTSCNASNSLLDSLINFLYALAIPFAILVIMYGGYKYFFGGLSGKSDGMKTIQSAVMGLILVLTARLITDTVNNTFSSSEGINETAITTLIESITGILTNLSVAAAILVIIWGGYKYFFGGFGAKADGMQTIRAGVIGLVFILLATFIANTLNTIFKDIEQANQITTLGEQLTNTITPIVAQVTLVLQGVASLISVLVIVWGGYQYFFSTVPGGKKDGMDTISKGVIGLVVTILASPIVNLVKATLGNATDTELNLDPSSVIATIQTIVVNFLIPVSAAATVFFFILGAYQWLSAGGDAKKVENGRTSIKNGVIGLVVVLLATTFTQIIIFVFRNADLPTANQAPTSVQSQSASDSTNSTRLQPTQPTP